MKKVTKNEIKWKKKSEKVEKKGRKWKKKSEKSEEKKFKKEKKVAPLQSKFCKHGFYTYKFENKSSFKNRATNGLRIQLCMIQNL